MNNVPNKPSLLTALNTLRDNILQDINCVKLGKIISVNDDKITVNVQPLNQVFNGQYFVDAAVIQNVPVMAIKGGNSSIEIPIADGDKCVLFFCDHNIDNSLFSDTPNPPLFPDQLHNINNAFALVGLYMDDVQFSENLTLKDSKKINITTPVLEVSETLKVGNGATGNFTTNDGKNVTVQNGIVTKII